MRSHRVTARGWVAFGLASAAVLYSFLFAGTIFYLADDARIAALSGLALPAAAVLGGACCTCGARVTAVPATGRGRW